MNLKFSALGNKLAPMALKAGQHSPALMFGAGIVGVVATAVLASRATLKLEEVLAETNEGLEKINANAGVLEGYTEQKVQRDKVVVYTKGVLAITKLYGPAAIVGLASVCLLTGSHVVLSRRNTALVSAYAALDKGFREYRKRVIGEYGEEKDREFYRGTSEHVVVTEKENGEVESETVNRSGGRSPYAYCFDEANPNWNRNQGYNSNFIGNIQNWANDMLLSRGYILLNDVLDMLGADRTEAGCVVGWVKDNEEGDGFVDFGVFKNVDQGKAFISGDERSIWLDFNVDGVVYKLIGKKKR